MSIQMQRWPYLQAAALIRLEVSGHASIDPAYSCTLLLHSCAVFAGAQDIAAGKRMMVSLVSIGAGLDTIGLAGANTLHWRVPQSIAQAGTQSSCSDAIS
jgi:hypothetical protein